MIPAHALAAVLLAIFAAVASRGRRRAVLAGAAVALGGAALRVAAGPDAAPETMPRLAVTIDAGLELLGALLAIAAGVAAGRAREMPAALLAGSAAAAAAWSGLRHAADTGRLATLAFALAGLALVELTASVARDRWSGSAPRRAAFPASVRWLVAGALAGAVAVFVPNAIAVITAAIVVSFAGHALTMRDPGRRRIPWLPLLATPPLVLASYFIVTIAGPTGLSVVALREGPFSPAAEALLTPLLAAGALPFLGMRPLTSLAPRSLLAPVGVAILARIGTGIFVGGAAAWETVTIPIGVISICIAAVTRDVIAAGAAMAWIASFSIGGAAGAWWLAGAVSGGSVLSMSVNASPRALSVLRVAVAVAGAWGAVAALESVLRTETLYGLLAWGAFAATAVRALAPARN